MENTQCANGVSLYPNTEWHKILKAFHRCLVDYYLSFLGHLCAYLQTPYCIILYVKTMVKNQSLLQLSIKVPDVISHSKKVYYHSLPPLTPF